MARKDHDGEPTLGEAWTVLGQRLGLTVAVREVKSIRAEGVVRGRKVTVDIVGGEKGAGRKDFARFFSGLNTISSRNRREQWHTVVTVGCTPSGGVTGTLESAVDLNDPAWKPGEFDPRSGRKVRADPPSLADAALTADTHERLMSVMDDVQIAVRPTELCIDHHNNAIPGSGANYVAGSLLHHYQGSPPPWPERALVGPPWWIDLLCDIADTLER